MSEDTINKSGFYAPVRVRFADTDLQGHVFFANYLTYCDEGFMAYLERLGYGWRKLGTMGLELYYVECSCQFKRKAFFGDLLHVNTRIVNFGKSSMTVEALISTSHSDDIVAVGRIAVVMASTQTGKSTPIPAEFIEAVKKFENL